MATQYFSKLPFKSAIRFGGVTLKNAFNYAPTLAIWGGASLAAVFVFTENWPIFQDAIFKKIPVYGSHWVKEIPPEDSPQ
ncbi:ubiquinol--cytochrome-c reductase subunit 10 Ecym_7268 [Eremothecium cymbalariae DBVPG|uniref:Cytochrome b-c1 complex subunit 10 n=1 Tax=Eremothecium cymbalariae (strain CBS 270.75 / DBVPG 7215 / KCTC 17166 / NRRL Y-17582) TaxID=931890 RepID=G8JW97_ERECY|nr:hypothetical protein Ecym_7268 [Eremothecium cymbalariae DBVPG\